MILSHHVCLNVWLHNLRSSPALLLLFYLLDVISAWNIMHFVANEAAAFRMVYCVFFCFTMVLGSTRCWFFLSACSQLYFYDWRPLAHVMLPFSVHSLPHYFTSSLKLASFTNSSLSLKAAFTKTCAGSAEPFMCGFHLFVIIFNCLLFLCCRLTCPSVGLSAHAKRIL